ncbi:MAG: ABC transporter permease [Planctomycetota bacterium]|nr:ABC transporter permease [Planctomycetota bacterium]
MLLMIPTLFGITFLTYVIIRSAPGTPTSMKGDLERGPQRNVLTAGDQGDYQKLLHLDKNPFVAYFYWAKDFFNPDVNVSAKFKTSVFTVILERMPNTLILNLWSILILYLIGLPLGIDSAVNAGRARERVFTVVLFLLYSLPSFWVALILIVSVGRAGHLRDWLPDGLVYWRLLGVYVAIALVAAWAIRKKLAAEKDAPDPTLSWVRAALEASAWVGVVVFALGLLLLGWLWVGNGLSVAEVARLVLTGDLPGALVGLPIAGVEPDNAKRLSYLVLLRESMPYFLMPLFCWTYSGFAGESRFMRVGMMEILRQDYVRTARAKGLQEHQVIMRHVLPNALTPIIVGVAGILPGMMGGSVLLETVFSIPGLGMLFYEGVLARDYNLIMANAFIGALLVLVGMLVSDLLLPLSDPRVSFEGMQA